MPFSMTLNCHCFFNSLYSDSNNATQGTHCVRSAINVRHRYQSFAIDTIYYVIIKLMNTSLGAGMTLFVMPTVRVHQRRAFEIKNIDGRCRNKAIKLVCILIN